MYYRVPQTAHPNDKLRYTNMQTFLVSSLNALNTMNQYSKMQTTPPKLSNQCQCRRSCYPLFRIVFLRFCAG